MNFVGRFFIAGLCLSALSVSVSATESDDPIAILDAIYTQYEEGEQQINAAEEYFSEDLLKLWRAVDEGSKNGVEQAVGFEIYTNSEKDNNIDNIKTRTLSENLFLVDLNVTPKGHAGIPGVRQYMMYRFFETQNGWKIDDIDWGHGKKTLSGMLMEILQIQSLR